MKNFIVNLILYSFIALALFILLCQIGIIPLRFIYLRSGSMRPTYQPGDVAFVYLSKSIKPEINDVVLFTSLNGPTIHRVVAIENGLITTKGDANNTEDKLQITKVDGKILLAIPKIGYLIDFIQFPIRWLGSLQTS